MDSRAIVAASKGVNRVDVGIARGTEGGGVGIAGDGSRSLLADLAEPDTWVARAGGVGVDLVVAAKAEESGVVAAEEGSGCRLAGVAEGFGGGDGRPAAGEGVHNEKLV